MIRTSEILMFHGVLALVERSLRVDSRSWQSHLGRLGLMAAIYCCLSFALWNSGSFGAPGLRFFYGIGYLNLNFMTLMGIEFFSTAISEEKEEDTLGLMLMAGISPLGILIGKTGGRLVQALLLVAVQYPFTLLAVTMGGVTHAQVSAMYLALTAYMVLLAGFGLLCSTVAQNNRTAASRMIAGLLVYTLVPLTASGFLSSRPRTPGVRTALDYVSQFSVFQQMGTVLTTGFAETQFSFQVVSNLIVGCCSFGLAWALFGVCSRQPASEAVTRGMLLQGRGPFRWLSPGRAWSNSLFWKDFYFVSGGVGMIPVRLAFYLALYALAVFQSNLWQNFGRNMVIDFFQMYLSLTLSIDASRVMARSLHEEIRGQTLPALMMLTRSQSYVIYSKLGGAVAGLLPGLAIAALVVMATNEGWSNFKSLMTFEGPIVLSLFVLAPNLAALLALFLRWGAVPLGLALSFGFHFMVILFLELLRTDRAGFFPLGMMMVLTLSPACHLAMMSRIRRLAAAG